MSIELDEVHDFLAAHEPFMRLPDEELHHLPRVAVIRYVRRGETIIHLGAPNEQLHIIRAGAIDVIDEDGLLLDRRDTGSSFGYSTLVGENSSRYTMVAVEDTLLIQIPREEFTALGERNPDLNRFYASQSRRVRSAAEELREDTSSEVLRTKLGDFKIPDPAGTTPDTSIRDAARHMEEANVSSLLIMDNGVLQGIITDRDLRGRVVATGLDISTPVSEVMTPNPRTVTSDSLAFEAMLFMAELAVHHLPVVDNGQVTGIVTTPDIMRLLRHDPIYLTADLSRRSTPEEMRDAYQRASEVAVRFIDRGASAEETAALIDGEATAKEFHKDSTGIWLLPHNEDFSPIPGDKAEIMGKIVSVFRKL